MSHSDKMKHNGKRYDNQVKILAVKLVTEQHYSLRQAAQSLGVATSTIWAEPVINTTRRAHWLGEV